MDTRARMTRIWQWMRGHRLSSIIMVLLLAVGGWMLFSKFSTEPSVTQYVLGTVARGDLEIKVKGTGQVSADNQVDLKPQGSTQSSATIASIHVRQGDIVKKGQLVAVIENKNALVALHQAQANLESAQANFDKINNGATKESIAIQEAAVRSQEVSLSNAEASLQNKIENAYNDALATVLVNTNPLFKNPTQSNPQYGITGLTQSQSSLSTNESLVIKINQERVLVNNMFGKWQSEITITDKSTVTERARTSVGNLNLVLTYLNDILTDLSTYQTNSTIASGYITSINSARATVSGAISTLLSGEQATLSARSSLAQSQASLAQSTAPARPEDVATSRATLRNARAALESAEYTYDQSFLRAPFDGVVAQVNVSEGDQANTSTIVASVITKEQIAKISLNELDAVSVKVGATTTLTFDALPDVRIVGKVVQIDTIGTVTSGVVAYNAKISFVALGTEVKPGMSVSAAILTGVERGELLVPSSAIKTTKGISTVLIPQVGSSTAILGTPLTLPVPPRSVTVEVGSSDNVRTVVVSGLSEGDVIVAREVFGATIRAKRGLFSGPDQED